MIQRIKSVGIMFLLLLISISCSGNNVLEGNKQDKSIVLDRGIEELENFVFFRSFHFCDNEYAAFTQEEANTVYLDKTIRLNVEKKGETLDWNSFFYEDSKQCIEKELGEKEVSSYLISTDEDSPFDKIVLFNNEYLLFAQDGFFFVFKEKREGELIDDEKSTIQEDEPLKTSGNSLKPVYRSLKKHEAIPLPIEFSYDFAISLNNFIALDDVQEIAELNYLTDFQFAKLPSFEKTRLLLVSGYLESGQSELHLLSLNQSLNVVDDLMLYTYRETEDGGIVTKFKMSKDFLISVTKEEELEGNTTILEKRLYKIDTGGNFIE